MLFMATYSEYLTYLVFKKLEMKPKKIIQMSIVEAMDYRRPDISGVCEGKYCQW